MAAPGIPKGQGRPGHQSGEVGVGAVIDPGATGLRVEKQPHTERGGERAGDGDAGAHPGIADPADQGPGDQRPKQIELLLDRQRPQVHEQARGGRIEVVRPGRDLQPIAGKGERPEHLPSDAHEQIGLGHAREQDTDRQTEQQGRQQAPGATQPEAPQVQTPGRRVLAEEQGGDQEAGDDEEDVDPEETARQPGRVQVVDDNRGDC